MLQLAGIWGHPKAGPAPWGHIFSGLGSSRSQPLVQVEHPRAPLHSIRGLPPARVPACTGCNVMSSGDLSRADVTQRWPVAPRPSLYRMLPLPDPLPCREPRVKENLERAGEGQGLGLLLLSSCPAHH